MDIFRQVAIAVAVLLVPVLGWGQQKGGIELTTVAEVEETVQNEKGAKEVKRMEASKAKVSPGDVVFFTTTYVNAGKQPATNVVITNPVPEHMVYVDQSAGGKDAKIDFSIDGGKTYATADKLKITDKEGRVRPALGKDYTHVRWVVSASVAPGAKGTVGFRARVK